MNRTSFSIEEANFSPYKIDSIVSLMIWDSDFLGRCYFSIEPKVFGEVKNTLVQLCYNYFRDYKEAPAAYIFDLVEDYTSRKPSKKKILQKYLGKVLDVDPNKDYILTTFGEFVRKKIYSDAIEEAKISVDRGNIKSAEETILKGFRDGNSVTGRSVLDYLEHGEQEDLETFFEPNIRSLIEPYDKWTGGGFFRKEMVVIVAPENVGKTHFAVYLGKVSLMQGKNVLHITLETSREWVWARYIGTFTSSPVKRTESGVEINKKKLRKKLNFLSRRGGKLWLYKPSNFGFHELEALVNNLEVVNHTAPDVIIIDSPDQMVLDRQYKDYWLNEGLMYGKFLDFAKDRNVTLFVTTQAGKKASSKFLTQGWDTSGSAEKIRKPDTGISLSQTKEEYLRNEMRMFLFRHRGAKKFLTVKLTQNLDIGQFIVGAEKINSSESDIKSELKTLKVKLKRRRYEKTEGK